MWNYKHNHFIHTPNHTEFVMLALPQMQNHQNNSKSTMFLVTAQGQQYLRVRNH